MSRCVHPTLYFYNLIHHICYCNKAGVPLTDYKRIGGPVDGGLIRSNLLQLFSTDRFDPIARPSDQITALAIENYLQSWDQSLTWQTTADYPQLSFSSNSISPTAQFFIRFSTGPSDPLIIRAMGRRLNSVEIIFFNIYT